MDPATLHRRTVESWELRVEAVPTDRWESPTPCSGWTCGPWSTTSPARSCGRCRWCRAARWRRSVTASRATCSATTRWSRAGGRPPRPRRSWTGRRRREACTCPTATSGGGVPPAARRRPSRARLGPGRGHRWRHPARPRAGGRGGRAWFADKEELYRCAGAIAPHVDRRAATRRRTCSPRSAGTPAGPPRRSRGVWATPRGVAWMDVMSSEQQHSQIDPVITDAVEHISQPVRRPGPERPDRRGPRRARERGGRPERALRPRRLSARRLGRPRSGPLSSNLRGHGVPWDDPTPSFARFLRADLGSPDRRPDRRPLGLPATGAAAAVRAEAHPVRRRRAELDAEAVGRRRRDRPLGADVPRRLRGRPAQPGRPDPLRGAQRARLDRRRAHLLGVAGHGEGDADRRRAGSDPAVHRRPPPARPRLRPLRHLLLDRARLHQHADRARPRRHPAARRRPDRGGPRSSSPAATPRSTPSRSPTSSTPPSWATARRSC